jgi:competence protein ComGF
MKLNLTREEGFTLLEALAALMVSSMIILLLSSGITQAESIREVIVNDSEQMGEDSDLVRGDRQIEWHLFLNQLENYLEDTRNPYVSRLYFTVEEWDERVGDYVTVRYERRGSLENFTRSKRGGNNRMLTGIVGLAFEQQDGWLLLDFQFRTGEKYLGRIWVDSWTEKSEEETNDEEDLKDTIDEKEDSEEEFGEDTEVEDNLVEEEDGSD